MIYFEFCGLPWFPYQGFHIKNTCLYFHFLSFRSLHLHLHTWSPVVDGRSSSRCPTWVWWLWRTPCCLLIIVGWWEEWITMILLSLGCPQHPFFSHFFHFHIWTLPWELTKSSLITSSDKLSPRQWCQKMCHLEQCHTKCMPLFWLEFSLFKLCVGTRLLYYPFCSRNGCEWLLRHWKAIRTLRP